MKFLCASFSSERLFDSSCFNEDVYIFRLGGYKVANIFADGGVQLNGQIPAIIKTLMSQTKDYKLPIEKTIVKSYIFKKLKFKTDLHTHMNANLSRLFLMFFYFL